MPRLARCPRSLCGLDMRKNDNYYRITTNRLPEAQIVVLDEPFKASSAILNVMLSIINERVFDNGGTRIDVPMISLYGASNELLCRSSLSPQ